MDLNQGTLIEGEGSVQLTPSLSKVACFVRKIKIYFGYKK
jgi:hypothetical protein